MKIEVSKKELEAIMDCVMITEGTLNGNSFAVISLREAVRRLGKLDFNALWTKLRNEVRIYEGNTTFIK